MAKFKLGQIVKVVHGSAGPFCGYIAKVEPKPLQFYRVESKDKDGRTFAMTVEEGWLELDEEPRGQVLDAVCFAQSLKSLAFHIGGTHVAGMVEEAEKAAKEGKVVKYE